MNCEQSMLDAAIQLQANAGTAAAEDLRAALVLALDNHDGVFVNAGETEAIGQAALQLLLAARREAASSRKPFAISNLSLELTEQIEAYGLGELLQPLPTTNTESEQVPIR